MLEKCVNGYVEFDMFKFAIKKAEETNFLNTDLLNWAKELFDKFSRERELIWNCVQVFEDSNMLNVLDSEIDF